MITTGYILLGLLWAAMIAILYSTRHEMWQDTYWTWKYIRRAARVWLLNYKVHHISSTTARNITNHTAVMIIVTASLMLTLS